MTWGEFSTHMDKVSAQFGAHHYSPERLKLIFREVAWLDVDAWRKITEYLIGESRYAPTLSEIREQVTREREKVHEQQKREHKRDAHDFWQAISKEDSEFIFGNIKARINGEMSDQDFQPFLQLLKSFRRN